jgi:TRAP-type C4-dicarboxylate transport system permease small subunit
MTFWIKAKWVVRKTNTLVCLIGMYLLIPMMFLTSSDVLVRAILARPIIGSIELCEYMLAVLILLGLGYTEQKKGNVKVGFILEKFPPGFQAVTDIITTLLSLFVVFILIWQGWLIAVKETTVSYMLRIPQTPFRLLVSIGGFLLCLELFIDLINAFSRLRRR